MVDWYAVKAKPRQEKLATNVLGERGIDVYLAEVPSPRRVGWPAGVSEPLFPGDLFARRPRGAGLTMAGLVIHNDAPE